MMELAHESEATIQHRNEILMANYTACRQATFLCDWPTVTIYGGKPKVWVQIKLSITNEKHSNIKQTSTLTPVWICLHVFRKSRIATSFASVPLSFMAKVCRSPQSEEQLRPIVR